MAKQPTKAMTLREAVEIVEVGRFDYCHPRGPDWDSDESRGARWDRARAIVDAAVEFVEANERECSNECRSDDFMLGQDEERARKKLRALERGQESEVQP